MPSQSNSPTCARPGALSSFASLFSMGVGLSVLLGWLFHVELLKSWLPGKPSARFNAAVCFVLMGFALWELRKRGDLTTHWSSRPAARIAAAIVVLVGLLTLSEILFGLNLGIDQWSYAVHPGDEVDAVRPGLIPPIAALDFVLLGCALLALDWKTRQGDWPAQFLAVAAGIGSLFGLLDFVLGLQVSHTHIALPSAVNFAVFSLGVVHARMEWAWGGLLVSRGAGAMLLRRVAPAALLVINFISWLESKALLTSAHFEWEEVSVIIVTLNVLLTGLIVWTALIVERAEQKQKTAEQALQIGTAKLDQLMERFEDSPVEKALRHWGAGGIALAALLSGFMGFLSWRSAGKAAEDADWVAHTHATMATLATTLKDAVDVETGARGFAVTGEEPFLEPYQEGQATVAQDLETLRQLIADPAQQRRLDRLEQQINARIEIARRLVAEKQETGAVPAHSVFLEGKRRMDAVRATVTEMQSEENKLLDQRSVRTQEARRSTKIITSAGTLMGVALLLLAGFRIGREINNSARMRGQLKALNADLEVRVEERTAELKAEVIEREKGEQEIRRLNAHLEQRVHERTAELEAANKELEAFTYSVSHDLRAPLRHISGFTKMLAEEHGPGVPPEVQHYLQRIQEATRRMGLLVDDLLNLARIGRQELRLQVTGLESITKDVIADLGPDTLGRAVEWKIGSLPFVECDPALTKQVFQNLLSNAVKFTRPRPQAVIEIGQKHQEGAPLVFVRDNGVGFSMKYADKLFGVFQRLHRPEDFEGTGVGLATVQRIIQKHGGRIWAEAELDKGATFYFTLGASEKNELKTKAAAAGEKA